MSKNIEILILEDRSGTSVPSQSFIIIKRAIER